MNDLSFSFLKGGTSCGNRISTCNACFVDAGCVHQHFNDDPDNEAILLVMKAKPLFLFMHLLFQKIVSYPPNEKPKGHEDWTPPKDL